ncbi:MAG: hypothetical protein K8I29_06175 [Alphaproteobacteria bacterium]|uniref:Uncharacterized protein n=1 Tax=Candidatus Nitrobium versatile TaxID=2884831 RepID=A0A953M0X8_9BACT|nr:hypothetical protein [Candidatus Nitrobium versatile]
MLEKALKDHKEKQQEEHLDQDRKRTGRGNVLGAAHIKSEKRNGSSRVVDRGELRRKSKTQDETN